MPSGFIIRNETDGVDIDLPRWPTKISHKIQADVKETRFPGALSLLLAFGRKANKLQLEGVLQESGKTKTQLVTDYSKKLEAATYKESRVTAAGMLYDSNALLPLPVRRYVFAGITFEERPGFTRAIFYNMELWEGSDIIQL